MMDRQEWEAWAERESAKFSARYGIRGAWTDEQLDRALSDHGLPPLAQLPAGPRGLRVRQGRQGVQDPTSAADRHRWRRTNAGHLLGHVVVHGGRRCDGCRDWGTDQAESSAQQGGI